MDGKKYTSIDEYIDSADETAREKLVQLRAIIKATAPAAEEVISYNMPAFRMKHVLVYFAAYKNHIGFYPTAKPIKVFNEELKKYKHSKGAIQFPLDEKLPLQLIKRMVMFRVNDEK